MKTIPIYSENSIKKAFPGCSTYQSMLDADRLEVRESREKSCPCPLSERHIQCLWYDSYWRPARLKSTDGREIHVVSPGRWNLEAGPDFLDAVLHVEPSDLTLKGSIEVHLHPRDWIKHAHSTNPAYSGIIAHVTYFHSNIASRVLPPGTVEIALADNLPPDWSGIEAIDIAAYPYNSCPDTVSPPCREALRKLVMENAGLLLRAAGEERLRLKAERLAREIRTNGPDETLYMNIMSALGYRKNRNTFRALAKNITLEELIGTCGKDQRKAYAMLLGVSGLLPTSISPSWDTPTSSFIRELWDSWWKERDSRPLPAMKKSEWNLSGLRPQNHPIRRLAAAAVLFTRHRHVIATTGLTDANSISTIEHCLSGLEMDYWKNRLSFNRPPSAKTTTLLGESRKNAIMTNVIVPFMAASGVCVHEATAKLRPEQGNTIVRQAAANLFGQDHNPAAFKAALLQQGLVQIFNDHCIGGGGDCGSCSFAAHIGSFTPPS